MDKEKTLQKIVQKAVDGGFNMKPYLPAFPNKKIVGRFLQVIYKEFIYTHAFAETYWGKEENEYRANGLGGEYYYIQKDYRFHLQRMILEKDHIKYLAKFLKK